MSHIFKLLFLVLVVNSSFAGWVKNNSEIKYIPDNFLKRVVGKLHESDRYDDFLTDFNLKVNKFTQNCNGPTNYLNLDQYNNKNETQNLLMFLFGEDATVDPKVFNRSTVSVKSCSDIMTQFKRNPRIIGDVSRRLNQSQNGEMESEIGESDKTIYVAACENFDKALKCYISNKNRILARSTIQSFQAIDSVRFKKYSEAIKSCLVKKIPISADDFIKLCKLRESDVYYAFSDNVLAHLNQLETLNDKISYIQSPFFKPNLKQSFSSCFEHKWVDFLKKRYIDGILKECDDTDVSISESNKFKNRESLGESKSDRSSSIGH